MRRVLFAAVLCASVAVPQAELEAQQVSPFFNTRFSVGDSASSNRKALRRDRPLMAAEGSGWSATKKGAWIGAAVGAVTGTAVAFLTIGTSGCKLDLSPCNPGPNMDDILPMAGVSAVGTGLGALVGAGVGKLVGALTADARP
jgi:hypothetical protein